MKIRKYILTCFCGLAVWTALSAQNKLLDSPSRKLQLAEFAISNLYVDKVDEDKLVETAIVSMLEKLDPHSTYSDPEEVKRLNEPLQGNFDGIGIQFNMANLPIHYSLFSPCREDLPRKLVFWQEIVLSKLTIR